MNSLFNLRNPGKFIFIGNERSAVDSTFINQFIQTGDQDYLSRCAECGYRGPDWKKRETSGTLGISEEFQADYVEGMRQNDLDFYRFLRSQREKADFAYIGYDVDKLPDIVFDKLKPFVARLEVSASQSLRDFAKLLKRSATGNFVEEAANLKKALKLQEQLDFTKVFDTTDFSDMARLLIQLEEIVRFASIAFKNPSDESLMAAYAEREKTMFRIVEELLVNPETKLVLLGHNAHLPKDHAEYRRVYHIDGNDQEVTGWLTLGSHTYDQYADETLAIWMLYDSGIHSAPFCAVEFPCEIRSLEYTLESWLASHHGSGLYEASELSAATNLPRMIWRENGIVRVTGDLSKAVDLIVFKSQVSGL